MEGHSAETAAKVDDSINGGRGLLTDHWSTSSGAEVMKPLATPVLGGMVSSLVHVLIVTP